MSSSNKSELFLSVIEANKGIIYKVTTSYCKDFEDRKDLVQEIILQLWKSFQGYDKQYKLSTWIYRISLNVSISFYRKKNSRKGITTAFTDSILNIVDLHENNQMDEGALFLHQFIAELKELDKALMLLYLEEKSHKEIAEIIGITETNVATKIGRIKTILKHKFSQVTI